MLKVEYQFKLKSALHTGSDEKTGIYNSLYREKTRLAHPIKVKSYFPEGKSRLKREALALIFFLLYDRIPSKRKGTSIWDEFSDALLLISSSRTKEEAITMFCTKFDIRSIVGREILGYSIPKLVNLFEDVDFLKTISKEYQYISALVYEFKEESKGKKIYSKEQEDMFASTEFEITGDLDKIKLIITELSDIEQEGIKNYEIIADFDFVPMLKGNGINGVLRRLMAEDYLKQIGLDKDNAIDQDTYDRLFTGGTLMSAKDANEKNKGKELVEDLELQQIWQKHCPTLSIFGGCISHNQTMRGDVIFNYAFPICSELGDADAPSYHNYLDRVFGVHIDDKKTEKRRLELVDKTMDIQMKYEFEVFAKGTPFRHQFTLRVERNEVQTSAFWRMIRLFCQNPVLGGKGKVGIGQLDLSELESKIPQNADKVYLDYLQTNKTEIANFLQSFKKS